MYCNKRTSRGVKRKLSDSVEEEPDVEESKKRQVYQAPSAIGKPDEVILRNCLTNTPINNTSNHYNSYNRNHQSHLHSYHTSCNETRGIIFNISMGKLSKYRQSPDPRLVRSVLICNTLKRLEKELEKEGLRINFGPSGVSFFSPVVNTQSMTLDPPPNATQGLPNAVNNLYVNESNYINDPQTKLEDDDSDRERYLLDLDSHSGRVTPFLRSSSECLYEKESVNDISSNVSSQTPASSALWNMEDSTDRLSSLNWSSVLNFSTSSSVNNIETEKEDMLASTSSSATIQTEIARKYDSSGSTTDKTMVTLSSEGASTTAATTSLHTLMPPTTISEAVSSVSHLINHHHLHHHHLMSSTATGSSNDEIFGDIDLSLYDFDLISPLSPPNVKLAPVSAEELMQSVASDSNGSSSSSSSHLSTSSLSPSHPLQLYSSHSLGTSISSVSSSPPTSCGSSINSTSAFQSRYFKSKLDEMSPVMS